MMKTYILSLVVLCTMLTLNACKKSEEVLTPSEGTNTYTLPQGTAAFDQTIVDYYNKYGTYLLYKFSEKDAYWTPTGWKKPVKAASGFWSDGAEVAASDPAYIPAQLALIQSKWFSFYSDKFLKKFLPVKILLCSKVDSITNGYDFSTTPLTYIKQSKKIGAFYNYDNIQVNYGDATINAMTATEQRTFLTSVNITFIKSIIARGLTVPTTEFINSADYTTVMTSNTQSFGKGIMISYYGATAQADWNAYITAMVSFSTVNMNASVANWDNTGAGIFNITKDTNGNVKKRYNMVRNYFINEYGVDLQLIGNASKGI